MGSNFSKYFKNQAEMPTYAKLRSASLGQWLWHNGGETIKRPGMAR